MRYLKTFEAVRRRFKVGDYVIVPELNYMVYGTKGKDYFANTVGQIFRIEVISGKKYYDVRYRDVPPEFVNYMRFKGSLLELPDTDGLATWTYDQMRLATPDEIKKLKIEIDTKKYNL